MDLRGTRTLHLVEPWSGVEPRWPLAGHGSDTLLAACALACRTTAGDHTVCLLGPTSAARRARALDMPVSHRIAPPLARPELAWRSVARLARAAGPFGLIVCWGARVGRLARYVRREARVVVTAVLDADGPASSGRPRQNASILRLPPPILSGVGDARSKTQWRRSMGIDDDATVLAMLDDPAHGGNARRFVFLLGTLVVAGRSVVGLMPSGAREEPRARRFQRGVSPRTRVITMDRPVHALLSECDIAVLFDTPDNAARPEGSAAGVVAFNMALAASAGTPVVLPDAPALSAFVAGPAGSCVAASAHPTDIGRIVHDLILDRQRRIALSEALTRSASSPSLSRRWSEQFNAVIRQAGQG